MYILSEINEGLCFVTEGFQVENEQFSNSIVRVPLLWLHNFQRRSNVQIVCALWYLYIALKNIFEHYFDISINSFCLQIKLIHNRNQEQMNYSVWSWYIFNKCGWLMSFFSRTYDHGQCPTGIIPWIVTSDSDQRYIRVFSLRPHWVIKINSKNFDLHPLTTVTSAQLFKWTLLKRYLSIYSTSGRHQ